MDRDCCNNAFDFTIEREKRLRIHKNLEQKLDSAVQGAQQKLYQTEAEIEVTNCEKGNQNYALQEIVQEFESQRFQLHQANRWADQAQRDKICLYGELDLKNRLFQENRARDCQEIEELRKICCEETHQARQARSEGLSLQQQKNPATVNQMMAQIQDLQNKANSLSDAREFYDSESKSSSGATHVPGQTSTNLSSTTLPRCGSGLPRNTQNCTDILGNVFEGPPAQKRRSYILQRFKEFDIFISRCET